jgi:uncharacterized protein (DUF433 family)
MTRPSFDRLWRRDGLKGGQPCIRGTGILVWCIVSRYLGGDSIRLLAKDYGVPRAAVEQCIALVASGAFGRRGLLADAERRIAAELPLEAR